MGLIPLLIAASAAAGEPEAYLAVGGRWTHWATGAGMGTLSGLVPAAPSDYLGDALYAGYDVDVHVNPMFFRRVEASVGVAGKWYVGALVEDDESWDQLRRVAGRLGFPGMHLLLETGRINGALTFGDEHDDPQAFRLLGQRFDGTYKHAALTFTDDVPVGVGVNYYQFPADLKFQRTTSARAVVDPHVQYITVGVYTALDPMKWCLHYQEDCEDPPLTGVVDINNTYVGWTFVEFAQTMGLGISTPSESVLKRNTHFESDVFGGLGIVGTFGSRIWLARSTDKRSFGMYGGVELRNHVMMLINAENETPPDDSRVKLVMDSFPMHVLWGPTFGAAARF